MMRVARKVSGLLAMGLAICATATAVGETLITIGNKPMGDWGWPAGCAAVANLPNRLGCWDGPPAGEQHFKYRSRDTESFNKALALFGRIHAPRRTRRTFIAPNGNLTVSGTVDRLLLVVRDRPKEGLFADVSMRENETKKERVDWTFTIWMPRNWHMNFSDHTSTRLAKYPGYRQPVPPPRIDVYVGRDSPIVWGEVVVPDGVSVVDWRAQSAPVDLSEGGVVRGEVFDMWTGKAIVGADVVLSRRAESGQWMEEARVETDDIGAFEIAGIPDAYYELHVLAEGYAARRLNGWTSRDGAAYREVCAELSRTASLTGTVEDIAGGLIPDVEVVAYDMLGIDGLGYRCVDEPSTTTDNTGRFTIEGLPEGHAIVWAEGPSLHQESPKFDLQPVAIRPWRKPEDVKIVMSGTGIIRGRLVVDANWPTDQKVIVEIEPKEGARVGSWGGSMQCDVDKGFEFKGVPPGEYVLTAKPNPSRGNVEPQAKPVVVVAGKTVEVDLTPSPDAISGSRRR